MGGDLPHARRIISHLKRNEDGNLIVDPNHLEAVSAYLLERLEDEATRQSVLDETLQLAHGAFSEGDEIELARQLVQILLLHPAGEARLASSSKEDFSRFSGGKKAKSAPRFDSDAPKGAVKLSSFLEPGEADRRKIPTSSSTNKSLHPRKKKG